MTMSPCFISPALPLTPRGLATSRATAPARVTPTAQLRFPGGGGGNPFNFNLPRLPSGFNFFGGFNAGSGMGGLSGGGRSGRRGGRRGGRSAGGGEGGASSGGNIFTNLWAAYNSRLDRFPIATKAFTSFVGFLLGDLLAQKFLGEKDADLDLARLARMAAFGLLVHGPTGHYFYGFLDRLIVGASPLKVAAKVAIDQVLWAPIFTVAFFTFLGLAERKSLEDIKNKIKNDTITGVTTSWKFWPLAHTINFAIIPSKQRLLYVNTLQVGYNVILSLIGNK